MKSLVVLIAVVMVIPLILLRGFVLSTMWSWFVCPLGIAPISFSLAVGLSLVVGLFHVPDYYDKSLSESLKTVGMIYLGPIVSLIFGWVVHLIVVGGIN